MKRPACFPGTHSLSHVQELSRIAQKSPNFLSCCLQNVLRSLTRAILPGQAEGWLFASGQHIERRSEHSSESVSDGQHSADHSPSASAAVAACRKEFAWIQDNPPLCSPCAHRQNMQVTMGFLPERLVQRKQRNVGLALLPVIVLIHS